MHRPVEPLTFRLTRHIAEALRAETVGGTIMLGAALVALLWANVGSASYTSFQDATFGPSALHLHLTAAEWASDGLLALFFFIAGMEVKRELVIGELSSPRKAALPVIAAICGMAVPAATFLLVSAGTPQAHRGWAIPMATDIAFALAVLAVAGSAFPPALRIFLLTLAVVDDLGAIVVIAVVYTSSLELAPLAAAVACLAAYAFLQWRRVHAWWLYVPIALATWGFVHASGIHATVAGVALGLLTRVRVDPGQELAPADRLDHYLRPVSAGFAVPIFALLAAGVPFGAEAIHDVLTDRIGLGIVVGLVVGKFVGVLGGSYLSTRFGLARLSDDLGWRDMTCVAVLTGVGFTVSLLICELAYPGTHIEETAKAAVLIASLLASVIAVLMLRKRSKVHRDAVSEDANSVAG